MVGNQRQKENMKEKKNYTKKADNCLNRNNERQKIIGLFLQSTWEGKNKSCQLRNQYQAIWPSKIKVKWKYFQSNKNWENSVDLY